MALPQLDNHDERIQFYELMLAGEIGDVSEIPLPEGYSYAFFQEGDRDAWIEIEQNAKELSDREQGLRVWWAFFGGRIEELKTRMVFVLNPAGEKVATATALYDVRGIDKSGDAWLHWVAVRREEQGKGLSKPLISHVIQIMKGLGYTRCKIPTQSTTWLAVKVYLDLGFRPIHKNLMRNRNGWRIIRRLTDHPALADLTPAEDEMVLRMPVEEIKEGLMELLGEENTVKWEEGDNWEIRMTGAPGKEICISYEAIAVPELTCSFEGWHTHIDFYNETVIRQEYAALKNTIEAILSGQAFAFSLYCDGRWLNDDLAQTGENLREAVLQRLLSDDITDKLLDTLLTCETRVQCHFWNSGADCEMNFSPRDFLRRDP